MLAMLNLGEIEYLQEELYESIWVYVSCFGFRNKSVYEKQQMKCFDMCFVIGTYLKFSLNATQ